MALWIVLRLPGLIKAAGQAVTLWGDSAHKTGGQAVPTHMMSTFTLWYWCGYKRFHRKGVGGCFEIGERILFCRIRELLAVREGLILASNCLVEMDATNVAASIKDNKASIGDAGFVLEDVKALCVKVQVSECHATPRSRNTMA
ncbi:hypothetical protein LWI29_035267 [Acer saccharum]|uniref:RNase H type-1 domain-containing protein n=1 Tax=Acer saccharum TaxID=4024 RepID=A0AA39SYJ5_ACESA|nr:hypothetical protein LWI29_035267 [Acer saccharum]